MSKENQSKNSGKEKTDQNTSLGASTVVKKKVENKTLTAMVEGSSSEIFTTSLVEGSVAAVKKRSFEKYEPVFADIAARLVASNYTQKGLARAFGVCEKTIKNWKRKHPEFKEACNKGKTATLAQLISKGLIQALGYDYTETNVKQIIKRKLLKDGTLLEFPEKEEISEFNKHQSGDNRTLMWMISRIASQLGLEGWELSHKVEIENKTVPIDKLPEAQKKQISELAGKLASVVNTKFIESQEVEK